MVNRQFRHVLSDCCTRCRNELLDFTSLRYRRNNRRHPHFQTEKKPAGMDLYPFWNTVNYGRRRIP